MIIDGVVTTNHYGADQALALTGTGEVYHEFKGLIKKLLGPVFLNPEALSSEISQSLTPRDIEVLMMRYIENRTLKDVSENIINDRTQQLGVSLERIRMMEAKSLRKIRDICRFAMDTDRPNRWDKFDYGTLL